MYSIADLSDEERRYLFMGRSFADYATEVEDFSRTNCSDMILMARQRLGATEPENPIPDIVRSDPPKSHWMLGQGQCRFLKIDSKFILSSEEFGKLVNGSNARKACRYCVESFLRH